MLGNLNAIAGLNRSDQRPPAIATRTRNVFGRALNEMRIKHNHTCPISRPQAPSCESHFRITSLHVRAKIAQRDGVILRSPRRPKNLSGILVAFHRVPNASSRLRSLTFGDIGDTRYGRFVLESDALHSTKNGHK